MASGSGRTVSGSKGFDFGSDDVLCSYDDFGNQEGSNGRHTDPVTGNNSGKDFRERRMGRSSLSPVYNRQEESLYQDLLFTVEKTMKKYTDNLLHFLEGISARLSQLELYCYDLEKSIGEMRSEITRENSEADSKLRSLEKHLQEVHRSVQILRDKQELADTQKELAKLQLAQKESSAASHSQHKVEKVATSTSDPKKQDDTTSEVQNQQLALALPHQINPPTQLQDRPMEQHQPAPFSSQTPSQNVQTQPPHTYYPQQNQIPNLPSQQTQPRPQDQYLQAESQYQRPQLQISQQPPQPHVSQPQQVHPFPQYQQQWPQQFPQQQVQQQQQQSSLQAQIGSQTPPVYPSYPPTQPSNLPPGTFPGNVPVSFSGVPQSGVIRPETMGFGYSGTIRPTVQQQPPQHNMQRQPQSQTQENTYGTPVGGDGAYAVSGSHPTQVPRQAYVMYDGEGGRVPHSQPSHIAQGGYPPAHVSSLQNPQPIRQPSPSQMMRNHPYGEFIEKAVSMGYPRDYVASVIHRMDESGQPMDFNAVLDRLNMHPSSASQRTWSA